ncbi:MAG: hypothetical protein LBS93_00870, partial [Synergistaceae bacterium]|nr:hypothetical protein [Synergistaceae bacterium]
GGFGTNFKSSGIKAGGFPILGDGDLVMFFTVDMPYVCFSIFPDRTDSVQAAIDAVREFSPDGEGVPAIFADDVRTLLASSRLSLAAVMDGDAKKVNQAYAVVESEASGPIDRLFTIAQIFINRPAAIEGWDSAYSITDGFVSESPFVLARKSNALMIGIGTPEAYGRMANVPLSIDVSGGEYLSNVFVSSQIIEAYRALQDEIASGMGGMEITSFLDIFSGVGAIQTRQGSPGTGDMSIFWKE